jgi:enoyl-CoA hydratase
MNLFQDYQTMRFTRDHRILTITMDCGDGRNAVTIRSHEELARIFDDVQRDPDSDVVILTGTQEAFSAGGDMAMFRDAPPGHDGPGFLSRVDAKRIIFSLLDLEKPIIAKVRGPAIGLGASLALLCDVIFAAEGAVIADPHVRAGIVAGDGGAIMWPQLIGYARAKEYLLTGDPLTAKAAADIGLINHCLPDDKLDAAVAAFAQKLARGHQKAIRWTKVATNIGLKQLATAITDTALAYEWMTFETADHREAVNAFLEKRRPTFKGN